MQKNGSLSGFFVTPASDAIAGIFSKLSLSHIFLASKDPAKTNPVIWHDPGLFQIYL